MEWFGLKGTSGTVGIPGKEQRRGLGGEGQARANGDGENDRLFGLEALLKPLPWALSGDLPRSPRAPARPSPARPYTAGAAAAPLQNPCHGLSTARGELQHRLCRGHRAGGGGEGAAALGAG